MNAIRLLLADDHPFILRGLRDFLTSYQDFDVVSSCSDGTRALHAIRDLLPDVALLDIAMPGLDGLKVLAAVQQEGLQTRVIFLTGFIESRQIVTAMANGASGICLKDATPDQLLHCIREVAAGRNYLPFEMIDREGSSTTPPIPIEKLLTKREWKVMELAAKGLSNKEISRKLGMTEGTTKVHLHHIFKKTGAPNRTSLNQIAVQSDDRWTMPAEQTEHQTARPKGSL